MAHVDHEQGVGQALHVLDAAQAALELVALAGQLQHFLLDQVPHAAVLMHALQLLQALDGSTDGPIVGQHAAQPAVGDVRHATTLCFFLDDRAGCALGSDEHDGATLGRQPADEIHRVCEQGQGFFEVDNVDLAAGPENERSHLGIPVTGLVTEMHAGFQQLTHGDICHF